MKSSVNFSLRVTAGQAESLQALQRVFAAACNYLAPIVRDSRCWNRVALHHLAYKNLRERFPQLGSQMSCNAIYSVCRFARIVYQHSESPWNIHADPEARLPLLRFLPISPVYFDRHTLSLRGDRLSLFTLDGRMRFQIDLSPDLLRRLREERVREIALLGQGANYVLHFRFGDGAGEGQGEGAWEELPEYLIVEPDRPALSRSINSSSPRARVSA